MQFDWLSFALQTINFVVLVWLLHRFLYRPVLAMIDARRRAIDEKQKELTSLESEAKAKLAEIASERAKIAAERAQILEAATAEADKSAVTRRKAAEREAEELLTATRKTLAAERASALASTRRMAVDLGVEIARRLLAEIPTEQRAETWLNRVEQHIAGLSPEDRSRLFDGVDRGSNLEIVTAIELSKQTQQEWQDKLHRVLGDHLSLHFSVDPELVAGVDLHFPNAILQFSWKRELASMRAEIETDAQHR